MMNTQLQLQGQQLRSLSLTSRLLAEDSRIFVGEPFPGEAIKDIEDIEDLEDEEYLDVIKDLEDTYAQDLEDTHAQDENKDKKEVIEQVQDMYIDEHH